MKQLCLSVTVAILALACEERDAPAPTACEADNGPDAQVETETGTESDASTVPGTEEGAGTPPDEIVIRPSMDVACPDGDPAGTYDRSAMLERVHSIVLQVYEWFEQDAIVLDHFVAKYCAAIGTDEESSARDTAQEAFHAAMYTWATADIMTMGPSHHRGDGEGLRDQIYSWKVAKSPCAVDHQVASFSEDPNGYSLPLNDPTYKGLDALEYLLFEPSLESACGSIFAPNHSTPAQWSDLSHAERMVARCSYSKLVTGQLVADARTIVSRWESFRDTLVDGTFNQGEQRDLVGDELIYHALYLYVDKRIRELKTYLPLGEKVYYYDDYGIDLLCGKRMRCAEEVEAPFSKKSKEIMLANFAGFDMLFCGTGPDSQQGQGFRDLLFAAPGTSNPNTGDPLTGPEIQSAIESAAAGARAELSSLSGSFFDAIQNGWEASDFVGRLDELVALFRHHIGKRYKYDGGITDMMLPADMHGDSE